jgi:hypothetical protein
VKKAIKALRVIKAKPVLLVPKVTLAPWAIPDTQDLLVPKVKRAIKVMQVRGDCQGQPVTRVRADHKVHPALLVMKVHADQKATQDRWALRVPLVRAARLSTLAMAPEKLPVAISHCMLCLLRSRILLLKEILKKILK